MGGCAGTHRADCLAVCVSVCLAVCRLCVRCLSAGAATESFAQHDVQEMFKKLFDALEYSFVGTPQEGLMQALYEGVSAIAQ